MVAENTPQGKNELVKKLLEARPYGTATAAFLHQWEGSLRVPRTIIFPGGLERQVGYMRDGILTFQDGEPSATYERVLDDSSNRKAIVVYYKINDPKVCN